MIEKLPDLDRLQGEFNAIRDINEENRVVQRNIEDVMAMQFEPMNHGELMGEAPIRNNNIDDWVGMVNMEQRIAEERERQEEDLF